MDTTQLKLSSAASNYNQQQLLQWRCPATQEFRENNSWEAPSRFQGLTSPLAQGQRKWSRAGKY